MAKSDNTWNDYIEIPLEPALKQRVAHLLASEQRHSFLRRKSRRLGRQFGQKHKIDSFD